MTLLTLLKTVNSDDLKSHIDDLLRQKEILQSIEEYSNDRFDFGDIIETYHLLVAEIERLQKLLRVLPDSPGERGVGEEAKASSSNYLRVLR